MLLYFLVSTLVLLTQNTVAIKDVCVEGFVMDQYCIDLRTLLDAPSVVTLENPELHSVHCLVDVAPCLASKFNILLPNPSGSPKFGSAFRLDDNGKNMVIELGRSVGICGTCKGSGNVTHGLRATFFGEVDKSQVPALLTVSRVLVSPLFYDSNSKSDGCPVNATKLNVTLDTSSGSLTNPSIAHGSFMIFGWGFLLPTGVVSAHFLKHRPNALWFKVHRIMQMIGLLVAIVGWIVALVKFDVFTGSGKSYNHGVLGMTVMVIGILQPLNAFVRPHPPENGESRPLKRLLWEIVHKSFGYSAIVLAAVTICLGTFVIGVHRTEFRAAWGVTLAWILVFSLGCAFDKYRYQKANKMNTEKVTYTK